ncbi:hypothetical protein ACQ86E_24985 [Bradyrhizobium betae]|uniref:hypothetical protein n=1 Tax=Bradyrhizobium betae TaxID=244734 RepID=UPI003D670A20
MDGTNFVQFRNRETDRFLLSVNGAAALVDDFRQDQDNNSQWRQIAVAPGGRPIAAAPVAPRNPAYDLALADCREIGGYWTGSTCRRPAYITQPLLCRRGFQWSEATGECEWIGGGNCPPWQMGPGGACRRDLVCRGGEVGISGNGYQACYCPRGTVVWGDYPYFSCVASISRVAPYLVPAVVGGVVLGIINGGKDRPQVGTVFGNNKFCGSGQTGTPPNCVVAATCQPPLVGTPPNCYRQMPRPAPTPAVTPVVAPTTTPVVTPTTTPVVTPTTTPGVIERPTPAPSPTPTPTGAAPVCSNNAFLNSGCKCELPMRPTADGRCFAMPSAGQACLDGQNMSGGCVCLLQKFEVAGAGSVCATSAPRAGTVCQIGQTKDANGNCVSLNASITCTGGRIEQGVCGCPPGTTLQGSGINFQCVAGAAGGNNKVCQIGETKDAAGNCVKLNASVTCTGGRIEQGVCGCPTGTTLQGSGSNFQCVAGTGTTLVKPDTNPRQCNAGENPQAAKCLCPNSMTIVNNVCTAPTTIKPDTNPRQCNAGENPQAAKCLCPNSMTIVNNVCTAPTTIKPDTNPRQCNAGENPQAAKCLCPNSMTIVNNVCTAPTTIKPDTNPRQCNAGENPQAAKCLCPNSMTIVNNVCIAPTTIKPDTNPRQCNAGENPRAANCLCPNSMTIVNNVCTASTTVKPDTNPRQCNAGENPRAANCLCPNSMTIVNNVCTAPTTVKPDTNPRQCNAGENPRAANCLCPNSMTIVNNVCTARTTIKPDTNPRQCNAGENPQAANCLCPNNMRIVGGICTIPSNIMLAPKPPGDVSPGQVGTPPNCKLAAPPTPAPTALPKPVATPAPLPTAAPKPVATPSPNPTAAPKPVVTPSPIPKPEIAPPPKPVIAPPPAPKPVTPPPPPPPKPRDRAAAATQAGDSTAACAQAGDTTAAATEAGDRASASTQAGDTAAATTEAGDSAPATAATGMRAAEETEPTGSVFVTTSPLIPRRAVTPRDRNPAASDLHGRHDAFCNGRLQFECRR